MDSFDGGGGLMAMIGTFLAISGIIWLITIVGMWKVFEKAGKPGWAAIVPVYNFWILIEISGRPPMFFWILLGCMVLSMIPIVGFILGIGVLVILILVSIDVAKKFGKDTGYGIGLALLSFIFYPMLGFSDAQYQGDTSIENTIA